MYRSPLIFILTVAGLTGLTAQCPDGYLDIDGGCFWEPDITYLQMVIDNSAETIHTNLDDNDNGMIEPLEVGYQSWSDGRLGEWGCYNCGLSGELPPDINALDALTSLNLGNNQLSGVIPEGIGSCTALTILYLNHNEFSGSIPEGLGDLILLENLYLHENHLSGSIPPGLGGLPLLEKLYLKNNELTGTIPPQLGDLVSLRQLYLGFNSLSGEIPAALSGLGNLEELILNDNEFTGILPGELGQLTQVEWLWLQNNQFTGAGDGFCDLNVPFYDVSCGYIPYFLSGNNCFCGDQPICLRDAVYFEADWNEDSWMEEYAPQSCGWYMAGDINLDTFQDVLDIVLMVNFIMGTAVPGPFQFQNGDINEDGIIDVLDIIQLVNLIVDDR